MTSLFKKFEDYTSDEIEKMEAELTALVHRGEAAAAGGDGQLYNVWVGGIAQPLLCKLPAPADEFEAMLCDDDFVTLSVHGATSDGREVWSPARIVASHISGYVMVPLAPPKPEAQTAPAFGLDQHGNIVDKNGQIIAHADPAAVPQH